MARRTFFIDKYKISLLYKHYLLDDLNWLEPLQKQPQTNKQKNRITWFLTCLEKEKYLITEIEKRLKAGWDFSRLPPLEKAVLVYVSYEIFFNPDVSAPSLINQIIEFSKKYLEAEKYKYINKVLDLLFKSSPEKTTKNRWITPA